jgi:transposase
MEDRKMAKTQKKAVEEGMKIIFVDESGFYLLPMLVRTYAPRGETPILKEWVSHDHLSVMSGITLEGKLSIMIRDHSLSSKDVITFLQQLQRQIHGKLLIIWDGSPIHRSKAIKAYLASGGAKRIHLERLPGYAPELNPDEGVWSYLKRVELKNVVCKNLSELEHELRKAVRRLRPNMNALLGFIHQPGFYV